MKLTSALKLDPNYTYAHNNLGNCLQATDHPQEALVHLNRAVELDSKDASARSNRALAQVGAGERPIGVHSPGYVADSDEQAREELWLPYKGMRDRIGAERGWPPMNRAEFEQEIEHGSLYVGAPETVAQKIAATVRALGVTRFGLKYSAGTLAHDRLMRSIELYGRTVIPRVRELLA